MGKKKAILCSVSLFTLISIFVIFAMFIIPEIMVSFTYPLIAGYAVGNWILKNACKFYEWLRRE